MLSVPNVENGAGINEEDYLATVEGSGEPMKTHTVGRNDPCPCGSGKKYKKCCLGKDEQDSPARGAAEVVVPEYSCSPWKIDMMKTVDGR